MKTYLIAAMLAAATQLASAADFFGEPVIFNRTPASPGNFTVGAEDQNFRQVLARWSKEAGWAFGPEHWTVDRDIPVVGSASLGNDFKTAVRELLGSTELGDLPVKPCFYTNRVLRVVPQNEKCDRTKE